MPGRVTANGVRSVRGPARAQSLLTRRAPRGARAQGRTLCLLLVLLGSTALTASSTGCFFSEEEQALVSPLLLFLENGEHPGFPPSWTRARHAPVRPPSVSQLARPTSFTSFPGEVMEQHLLGAACPAVVGSSQRGFATEGNAALFRITCVPGRSAYSQQMNFPGASARGVSPPEVQLAAHPDRELELELSSGLKRRHFSSPFPELLPAANTVLPSLLHPL